MIAGVLHDQARNLWPLVEPILKRATDRTDGRLTTDDVFELIERRDMQLWIGGDPISAACVTEVLDWPNARECRVVLAAGDLDIIRAGQPMLEAWARSRACSTLAIEGRPGWQQVLDGFRRDAVILRKRI